MQKPSSQGEDPARLPLELAAGVAHDIRNCLAVVQAARDLIESACLASLGPREREKAEVPLHYIGRNVQQLSRMATNLLDVCRWSAGEMKPYCQVMNLTALCRDLCEGVQAYCDLVPLQLKLELPESDILLQADFYFVERILLNLLSNAFIAAPKGTVVLRVRQTEKEALVCVEDDGPGFSPRRLADPFAPEYYQERGKTCLGLYISDVLARSMEASLLLENRPEGGARVVLTLPVREELSPAQAMLESPAQLQRFTQQRPQRIAEEFAGFLYELEQ